jgi:phage terminase large subunit-like protein
VSLTSAIDSANSLAQFEPELLGQVLTVAEQEELATYLETLESLQKYRKVDLLYPETGPLRRELYPKHLEFFAAGKIHRERACISANRVGKTWGIGAYETTLHLTGLYPDWWVGRRFDSAVMAWAAGVNSKTVHEEILQPKLLGKPLDLGSGMIPRETIARIVKGRSFQDAIETVYVKHVSGGLSELTFKSYEQGHASFQGPEKHVVWLDEECEMDIYTECLTRTMTTGGIVMCTFTPLWGQSEVVRYFRGIKEL